MLLHRPQDIYDKGFFDSQSSGALGRRDWLLRFARRGHPSPVS
jgi:hypothetical protein